MVELTDAFLADELGHLGGEAYLDYGGAGLYARSQVKEVFDGLCSSNFHGNPHSSNASGLRTRRTISEARDELLRHFNVTSEQYTVVFTSGATGALKLVGELFPFRPGSVFSPAVLNHNSVLGIREYCNARGGRYNPIAVEDVGGALGGKGYEGHGAVEVPSLLTTLLRALRLRLWKAESTPAPSLLAFPLLCNFSGRRIPLSWCGQLRERQTNWFSLVDAAAAYGKYPIDLSDPANQPDFVAVSFYKAFGYPTGLGALLVRKGAEHLLEKKYFGGGTVEASSAVEMWHHPRSALSERLEDGTPPFLEISAALCGMKWIERLCVATVARRLEELTVRLVSGLRGLRHGNGAPVVAIYGHEPGVQYGAVVAFNVVGPNGSPVGYAAVTEVAKVEGIHLRGGCFCNPGACQHYLQLTMEEVRKHREAGHVCGDHVDVVNGRPTGAIRASLGPYTRAADIEKLVAVLDRYFAVGVADHSSPDSAMSRMVVTSLFIYPVKGCRALRVTGKWPVGPRGLAFDRVWCIMRAAEAGKPSYPLGQKACQALADLQPLLLFSRGVLVLVHLPSKKHIEVPLESPDTRETIPLSVRGRAREGVSMYPEEISSWLEEILGVRAHLGRRMSGGDEKSSLANESALLAINSSSLRSLNEKLPRAVDPLTFRPNLVVEGPKSWEEDRWNILAPIPSARDVPRLTALGPCTRCQQITVSPEPPHTPSPDFEPLKTLMRIRRIRGQAHFGVNIAVEAPTLPDPAVPYNPAIPLPPPPELLRLAALGSLPSDGFSPQATAFLTPGLQFEVARTSAPPPFEPAT